eukprot:gene3352-3629_t
MQQVQQRAAAAAAIDTMLTGPSDAGADRGGSGRGRGTASVTANGRSRSRSRSLEQVPSPLKRSRAPCSQADAWVPTSCSLEAFADSKKRCGLFFRDRDRQLK